MEYTKEQVVQFTINILSDINVPVTHAEEIGVPVQKAIKNLDVVLKMMEIENQQREAEKEEACETDVIDFGGNKDGDGKADTK